MGTLPKAAFGAIEARQALTMERCAARGNVAGEAMTIR